MRMPRIRFTVRWMTITTAVLALVFGGVELKRRSVAFRKRVVAYRECEKACYCYRTILAKNLSVIEDDLGGEAEHVAATNLESILLVRISYRGDPITDEAMKRRHVPVVAPERLAVLKTLAHEEINHYSTLARSHLLNRRMYEHAARYPWLPVAPEAPEPK